jgi:5-aminopentanamidase
MTGSELYIAVADGRAPVAAAAAAAEAAGADLLVLPRRPDASAEASDGATAHVLGEVAARHRLAILFAYVEACSGQTHLALQLVLADGRSTANYRATHLGPAAAACGWTSGNWLTMTRLEPLTIGLMAGLDHLAPEVGRALSGRGAEALIAVADASLEPAAAALGDCLARLRALENAVPVCLVGPDGSIAAAAGDGAALAVASVDGLRLVKLDRNDRPPVVPRRPDLYRQLVDGAAE